MRIAVCDDDRRIREILVKEIGEYAPDAEVIPFKNGEELLHAECIPDILFLDIEMPGMTGLELAMEVKKTEAWKGLTRVSFRGNRSK